MKMTKTTIVSGFAVLAIAGAGVGVAAADTGGGSSSGSGTPVSLTASTSGSATPTATAEAGHTKKGHAKTGKRPLALRRLAHVEHGEATMHDGRVIDLQRGTVESVDATSITVKCQDGYVASYTVTTTTKVRKDKQASTISHVTRGDRVTVIARRTSTVDTAVRIFDPGTVTSK